MSNRAVREGVVKAGRDARVPGRDPLRERQFYYRCPGKTAYHLAANSDDGIGHVTAKPAIYYFRQILRGTL